MMERVQTKGLVLYNRNFREEDKLVKIFTEQAGKRMFFVKHVAKSKVLAGIQPLTLADYVAKMNDEGLSYIEDFQPIETYKVINGDIFKLSYASYLVSLADAVIQDNVPDAALFAFLQKTLELMEAGLDEEILTNIFEIQLLSRFGVGLNFHECAFCHQSVVPFDYSYRFSGVLCPNHYHQDERRAHVDPNVLYLIDQFQAISFEDLETIAVKPAMKRKLRLFIDQLYDEYVGIHLKAKKFIDDLQDWGAIMKGEEEKK